MLPAPTPATSRTYRPPARRLRPDPRLRLLPKIGVALLLLVPAAALAISGAPSAAAPSAPLSGSAHAVALAGAPGAGGSSASRARSPSALLDPLPTSTNETINAINGTILPGNVLPTNLINPFAPVIPLAGSSVVAGTTNSGEDMTNGEIFEFDAATGTVLGSVSPGAPAPRGLALDPATNTLWVASIGTYSYVSDQDVSNVTVVDASNLALITTLPAGNGSFAVAFDPMDSGVAVVNLGSNNLWFYNATTYAPTVIPVGNSPAAVAYDAALGYLVVANQVSNNLTVLDASTLAFVRTISLSGAPDAIAVDAAGAAFVAQGNATTIAEVDLSTGVVTAEIGSQPKVTSLALDPARDVLYATGTGPTDNVTEYNVSSESRVGSAALGTGPHQVSFSPGADAAIVTSRDGDTLTVLPGSDPSTGPAYRIGYEPGALVYDPTDARVFFADQVTGGIGNLYDGGLSVNVTGTIAGPPGTANSAWDSLDDRVWFGGPSGPNVTVLNAGPQTYRTSVDLGVDVGQTVYDPGLDEMFTVNPTGQTVVPANATTNAVYNAVRTVGYPISDLYDPLDRGHLYVGSGVIYNFVYSSTIAILNPNAGTTLATVQSGAFITAMVLDPANQIIYAFNEASGNLTEFSASTDKVVKTPTYGNPIAQYGTEGVYDPVTGLIYLTEGSSNSVALFDPATSTIVGSVPVGVDPSGIAYDYQDGYVIVANQGSGTLSLIPDPGRHTIQFSETGLPAGTSWSVSAQNMTENVSAGSTATFYAQSGELPWSAGTDATYSIRGLANGTLDILSSDLSLVLDFYYTGPKYPVQFNEVGLPFQAYWSVTIGNQSVNSTGASLQFHLDPGEYNYSVGRVAGYVPGVAQGNFTLLTTKLNLSALVFSPALFGLLFTETGLPSGQSWGVSLNANLLNRTTTSELVIDAPNGSYTYTALNVPGYTPTPSTGPVVVNGSGLVFLLVFSSTGGGGGSSGSTLSGSGVPAVAELGILGLAVVLIIVALVIERRDRRAWRESLSPSDEPAGIPPTDGAMEPPAEEGPGGDGAT